MKTTPSYNRKLKKTALIAKKLTMPSFFGKSEGNCTARGAPYKRRIQRVKLCFIMQPATAIRRL
ncbi:hypothetical protein NQ318_012673 [Aromia moschata]|uniref:Uncharacterized protein n=1 Tax=Aromia moschata TaxID=1265417 RepID=A0AAV8YHW7_9CUCU|nr:hypothetical protein NQ318_012673 [Aromia moschata]